MSDPLEIERKQCPECGSTKFQRFPQGAVIQFVEAKRELAGLPPKLSDYGLRVTVHICDDCGYVRLFSRPDEISQLRQQSGS